MYMSQPIRAAQTSWRDEMFTSENSTFDAAARDELNKALEMLLADVSERNAEQASGSYSDMLNNAWFEGASADELVAAVRS
jgi:hypothetical protein